ncbi:response regulator transcription factor [uncultured Cellulomonas sp.]|uniref:response regulator transcription factor n=1 Tax=uncultured Cellulomonas sp. TaxID=189682 RepID=UPI00262E9AB9|nr:response regulator transcription factor [uncultured Cellulomonas sp.]
MDVGVLVVADDEIVRATLCVAVRRAPGLVLVGATVTASDAGTATSRLHPDVVLLDDHLHHEDWIGVCRRMRSVDPDVAVLVLTSLDDDDTVLQLVLAGAAGCVLRDLRRLDVADTVRCAGRGGTALDPAAEARVRARLTGGADPGVTATLTPSQRRVVRLVASGLTDRQVADTLAVPVPDATAQVAAVVRRLRPARPPSPTRPAPAGQPVPRSAC